MPLPWLTHTKQDESNVPLKQTPVHTDGLKPPRNENSIDFSKIDTKSYMHSIRSLHDQRNVVASAKTNTDVIDKFCEERTKALCHDCSLLPDDYGVDKNVESAFDDERLVRNLKTINVHVLNAVQQKAIKIIRDGLGLLVEAPTGIGKTYAYLIPSIERALKERRSTHITPSKPSPTVLILASTNALVDQLYSRCLLVLGVNINDTVIPIEEIKVDKLTASYAFTKGQCDIAFCTMGKLKSSIERGDVSLDNLKMIVLDEADKMTDSSAFGLDISWVLDSLKEDVLSNLQSCLLSATFVKNNENAIALTELQMRILGNKPWALVSCPKMPGYIKQNLILMPRPVSSDITSHIWVKKIGMLTKLIDEDLKRTKCSKEGPYKETIAIFCETVARVIQVTMTLRQLGYNFVPACRIITKQQQAISLNDLEFRRIHGIVCSNAFSRGIDVSSVKHTIILEMSPDFDTYKHRIGRVGRDGTIGKATVFIDQHFLRSGHLAGIVDQLYIFMVECEEHIPEWLENFFQSRNQNILC